MRKQPIAQILFDPLAENSRLMHGRVGTCSKISGAELLGTWGPDLIEAIYLPYWSERPEDACTVYPRVFHREIPTRQEGNRYFANYSLLVRRFEPGPPGVKSLNISTDARSTPFLVGWHGETAQDLAARWETFLHGLETTAARPTDPLDAAFLRFADAVTWQDKAAALAVLRERLWDARDTVLAEERVHAYVNGIDDSLDRYEYERRHRDFSIDTDEGTKREPRLSFGRAEIHRWVNYYLDHAQHDDYNFTLGLGLIDPFTADEAAEFYRGWTAMKARLDARAHGWRTQTPTVMYSTIESRWLGRFPSLAPPTPPGALAVKHLGLLPGLAETVTHGGFLSMKAGFGWEFIPDFFRLARPRSGCSAAIRLIVTTAKTRSGRKWRCRRGSCTPRSSRTTRVGILRGLLGPSRGRFGHPALGRPRRRAFRRAFQQPPPPASERAGRPAGLWGLRLVPRAVSVAGLER